MKKRSSYWATAWVDYADNPYAIGDGLIASIKAKRDAYITLLNVGASGQVHVLFPNRLQTNNFVRAGQTVRIPGPGDRFAIQARALAGRELIKVIVTQKPDSLFDPSQARAVGPYFTLSKNAAAVAKDLARVLRRQHGGRWSEYVKVIRIVPRR